MMFAIILILFLLIIMGITRYYMSGGRAFQKSIHLTSRMGLDTKHTLITLEWDRTEYLLILSPQSAQIIASKDKKYDEFNEK